MVDPLTTIALKGLLPSSKQGSEAAVSAMAHLNRVATSMVKVNESQRATAAERAQVASKNKILPPRSKFSSKSKNKTRLKIIDPDWEANGAQSFAEDKELVSPKIKNPWSTAISADRLGQSLYLTA